MRIPGRVSNGVVVLEGGKSLPEGAEVIVTFQDVESPQGPCAERIRFPIVRCEHPGTVKLTGQMIAEYLEDEDLLLDVNVWIALAFESHADNTVAARWFAQQEQTNFAFCRTTQQGFLRLATNPKVPVETLTLPQAWAPYHSMLRDRRIIFMDEPVDLEQHWRVYTEDAAYSPNIWTDAYLAAFARAADLHLVTFDSGFARYEELIYTHLA